MTGPEPWLLTSEDSAAGSGLGTGDSGTNELVASGSGADRDGNSGAASGVEIGAEFGRAEAGVDVAGRLAIGGEYGAP